MVDFSGVRGVGAGWGGVVWFHVTKSSALTLPVVAIISFSGTCWFEPLGMHETGVHWCTVYPVAASPSHPDTHTHAHTKIYSCSCVATAGVRVCIPLAVSAPIQ